MDAPEELYLIHLAPDWIIWSPVAVPEEGMRVEDAVRYVRADLIEKEGE